jgi:hypothetical protein
MFRMLEKFEFFSVMCSAAQESIKNTLGSLPSRHAVDTRENLVWPLDGQLDCVQLPFFPALGCFSPSSAIRILHSNA